MALHRFAFIILHLILLAFVSFEISPAAEMKLTNIECESLDESLIHVSECRLKIIRRGVAALNISTTLLRPLNAFLVNGAVYKKANGYKPFLYNKSIDGCKFLKGSYRNAFATIFFNFVAEYSNINHSCPFIGDVVIKNFILTDDKFRLVPVPSGEYMVKAILITEGKRYLIVKVYGWRNE